MNEPLEHSVTIESINQLEKLALTSENLCLSSLEIRGLATLRLPLIELLISKNRGTLQNLVIDGASVAQKIFFTEDSCMHLAAAIKECQKLKKLAIINYKSSLRNGIQFFTNCLTKLPSLIELNFNTTYLASYAETLLANLAVAKSIVKIDLTHAALLTMTVWSSFGLGLRTSTSLREIVLGTSPLQPGQLSLLMNGLMSSENAVTVLDWTPLPFDENEALHRELSAAVNWFGQSTNATSLAISGKQLAPHREIGFQSSEQYQVNCQELGKAKKFIAQRNNKSTVTDLFIEIENEVDFSLDYIAAQILAQRDTLKKLIVQFKSIERADPLILDDSFDFFVRALQACSHLTFLNIENFQGTFTGTQLEKILQGLANLPKLSFLSFKKTYLGERGVDALTHLLKRNRITELNLTLAGLISDNCFMSLAKAIAFSACLRKIMLDNSPMTVFWAKLLVQAVEKNRSQHSPEITWHSSPRSEMTAKMHAMCVDLTAAIPVNDIIYIYNKFITDSQSNPNVDCKNLDDFINHNSSSENLAQTASANAHVKDIELDELASVPLVSRKPSAAKASYGAISKPYPK